MLDRARFVAYHDLRTALRAKETFLWVFVMPVVFIFFIGSVTGGSTSTARNSVPDPIVVVRGSEPGLLADQLEQRLEDRDFAPQSPAPPGAPPATAPRLVLPDRFTERVLSRGPARIEYTPRASGRAGDWERMRIARAVYTVLADLAVVTERGGQPSAEAFRALDRQPRTLSVRVESAGAARVVPGGYEQAVPGILVMFTVLVLVTHGAGQLVAERRLGVLRRLAASPISRRDVVLGKWAGKLALGLVQVAFAVLVGSLPPFRVDWGHALPAVGLVLVAYAGMMASIGLLVGCLARSEGQAVGIGVLAANALGALGGCWWPIEIAPGWMQRLALFLPTGWAMDALHRLMSFGQGPAAVVPHVLGMVAAGLAASWMAVRAFRFD